ncbi:MAG: hypothetical protein RDV48_09150 [Candidatus Eremiobacteraeota bacterium]|nr:hypothetical protein [Candidatus Eremiobacteraeota bacterium]
MEKEVALMFSGGLDTTVAALVLKEHYERVHLVTVVQGFCLFTYRPGLVAKELQRKFGRHRFPHRVLDGRELFRLMRDDFDEQYRKYRSPLLVDLVCRLMMETMTIIYCHQRGISSSADGNSLAQDQIFIQQGEYLEAVKEFFGRHGITHRNPVLAFETREERMAKLAEYGLDRGSDMLNSLGVSSHFFKQCFCFGAIPSFCFTSGLRNMPILKEFTRSHGLPLASALEFRRDRELISERYIQDHGDDVIEL